MEKLLAPKLTTTVKVFAWITLTVIAIVAIFGVSMVIYYAWKILGLI